MVWQTRSTSDPDRAVDYNGDSIVSLAGLDDVSGSKHFSLPVQYTKPTGHTSIGHTCTDHRSGLAANIVGLLRNRVGTDKTAKHFLKNLDMDVPPSSS